MFLLLKEFIEFTQISKPNQPNSALIVPIQNRRTELHYRAPIKRGTRTGDLISKHLFFVASAMLSAQRRRSRKPRRSTLFAAVSGRARLRFPLNGLRTFVEARYHMKLGTDGNGAKYQFISITFGIRS